MINDTMNIHDIKLLSNRNSEISLNVIHNVSSIRNDDNNVRRIEDSSLLDIVKADRSLIIFLAIAGMYIYDENDQRWFILLVRTWQFALLSLGGIGFIWFTFIIGTSDIKRLIQHRNSDSIRIFQICGFIIAQFITPLLQVSSLLYGMNNIRRQFHQSMNRNTTCKILASCKRDAIIFYVIMALIVVIIDPFSVPINRRNKKYNVMDDIVLKYPNPVFTFYELTTNLYFDLAVTSYLTISMLFISLTIKQVSSIQTDVLNAMNDNKLSCDLYMTAKKKIKYLLSESFYSIQLLTIVAGINVLIFMFYIWNWNNHSKDISQEIILDLLEVPYLMKGIFILALVTNLM